MSAKISGIYKIHQLNTDRVYIGSAVDIKNRWWRHKWELKKGIHHSPKLQRAWNKYGADAFIFDVLEVVAEPANLLTAEQLWLDKTNAAKFGFNITVAAGSQLGMRRTDATKLKMSASHKGFKRSAEAIELTAASHRGRIHTPEARANMQAGVERREAAIRAAKSLLPPPPPKPKRPSRYKKVIIKKPRTRKPQSEETKAKISATRLSRTYEYSPELLTKMSISAKAGWEARKAKALLAANQPD